MAAMGRLRQSTPKGDHNSAIGHYLRTSAHEPFQLANYSCSNWTRTHEPYEPLRVEVMILPATSPIAALIWQIVLGGMGLVAVVLG